MTTTSLPRTQRNNTTPATRLKAERLTVLTINEREAYVEGDHDTYVVLFRSLSCSCPAGLVGMKCSHVQAAIRERARMHGFDHTAFSPNQQHAVAYAAMQRAAGKHAVEHCANGWYFVTTGKAAPVSRPHRSVEAINAAAEELYA